MIPDLNAEIRRKADQFGWNFIDGIFAASERHGYCASESWFVRLQDTFRIQFDYFGAVHPTTEGYQKFGKIIASSFNSDLYPTGDLRSPRRPRAVEISGEVREGSRALPGVTLAFDNFGGRAETPTRSITAGAAPLPPRRSAIASNRRHAAIRS